ncbi:MAG TPA: hypothetical protein VND42_04615 [Candidatus Acidoferrales bacterium]|nr:hypothetical protein [Candidatus Acidoferrales bacterium]
MLGASVSRGQLLRLVNKRTAEHQECRVVNIGEAEDGKWAVGVEFTQPAANFWQISFPPITSGIAPASSN